MHINTPLRTDIDRKEGSGGPWGWEAGRKRRPGGKRRGGGGVVGVGVVCRERLNSAVKHVPMFSNQEGKQRHVDGQTAALSKAPRPIHTWYRAELGYITHGAAPPWRTICLSSPLFGLHRTLVFPSLRHPRGGRGGKPTGANTHVLRQWLALFPRTLSNYLNYPSPCVHRRRFSKKKKKKNEEERKEKKEKKWSFHYCSKPFPAPRSLSS